MVPQSRMLLAVTVMTITWLLGCGRPEPALLGRPLDEWSRLLDTEEWLDRLAAVRAVGEMARRSPRATAPLEALLRASGHADSAVRYWAVRSLGVMAQPGAAIVECLHSALEDKSAEVRIWAAYGLCRQGDSEAGLPVLIAELRNDNGGVRLHAAHALEALGESSGPVVETLKGVLGDEFGYPERVATRMLKSLGELPPD